jgi:putative sigma-54 modulation protein
MQTPLQLTFRSMAHSDALAAHVHRRAERLEHLFDRIISCHVVLELASHRHRHGDSCRVTIHVGLPGHELLASHAPSNDATLDMHATADRAFDEAERQLEDWARRRREDRHGMAAPT